MCGISGALSLGSGRDLRALVERIADDQVRRGPDAKIVEQHRDAELEWVLGHNRLSIIDLSPEANQPMATSDGTLSIVFNGEIYNYLELREELERLGATFRTRSDTEVILAAFRRWGEVAFDRFIGMFAIALFDARTRTMTLVRDRFGVKPLYYWHDDTTLVFASTPGVIARWAGLRPNLEYADRGIRFKYYEDDGAIAPYAGMRALPPAHLLRVQRSDRRLSLELRRYYDLPARASALRAELANASMPELEGRLLELLRSACELRCRSDVALGVSVSGGVDSSAVAALLAEGARPLVGYSFADPDDAGSEGPLVAELARTTGMQPRYIQVRGREALAELFWATLGAQDAPFPHASIMAQYAVFRAARADGTIVLLGGQGGDEAFMGYRKFFLFYAQSIFRRRRVSALAHLVATVLPLAPSIGRRAGLFVAERRRYTKRGDGMGSLLRLPTRAPGHSMGMANAHGLEERQALDVMRYSLPTLLRYEDRNSMGNSVESRLPFMDQRVIEFGLALPVRAKLGNGYGKLILRRALAGSIPDRIRCNRDKRGFDVDQRAWIRGGLGAEIRSALVRRRDAIAELLPSGAALDTLFGDERLERDPQAFKEAVTLIWLGDRM